MHFRERLNQNPWITVAAIAVIAVGSLAFTVYHVVASRPKFPTKSPDAYFTIDDGKTFFTTSTDNIPPFDYRGQTAVHAYVFQSNGKKFVGYMERYLPEARQLILTNKATPATQMYGRELKRPGDTKWVKSGDIDAIAKLTDIHGPDGSLAEPVEP